MAADPQADYNSAALAYSQAKAKTHSLLKQVETARAEEREAKVAFTKAEGALLATVAK